MSNDVFKKSFKLCGLNKICPTVVWLKFIISTVGKFKMHNIFPKNVQNKFLRLSLHFNFLISSSTFDFNTWIFNDSKTVKTVFHRFSRCRFGIMMILCLLSVLCLLKFLYGDSGLPFGQNVMMTILRRLNRKSMKLL